MSVSEGYTDGETRALATMSLFGILVSGYVSFIVGSGLRAVFASGLAWDSFHGFVLTITIATVLSIVVVGGLLVYELSLDL